MHPKTHEALKGSIKKWKAIEAGKIVDEGIYNCALCSLFIRDASARHPKDCLGCPVAEKTGHYDCLDTPYYSFRHIVRNVPLLADGGPYDISSPAWPKAQKAATRMRKFLEGLLP